MSQYTTQVRWICEALSGEDNILLATKNSQQKIFELYTIFNENHREELNVKILRHFYFREIGFETYELWRDRLNMKMQLIMPYYNELYKSVSRDYDFLTNMDITKEVSETDNETQNNNNTATQTKNKKGEEISSKNDNTVIEESENVINRQADTPQNVLNGVLNDEYLTNVTNTNNKNNSNKNQTISGKINSSNTENNGVTENKDMTRKFKSDTNDHTFGKNGNISYTQLVKEYQDNIKNIDKMVIDELNELFISLYS